MTTITIFWQQTTIANLVGVWENVDFYVLTRGNNILYIGIAYHTALETEINQNLRRLVINSNGLGIYVGSVDISRSTVERRSRELTLDIESLLILRNQPSLNTHQIDTYRADGHRPLVVRNIGNIGFLQQHCQIT